MGAALSAAAALVAGCSKAETTLACPAVALRATPGPEAVDALMETYMRDGMAGRPVPEPADRQAARRAIAMDCVNARVDATPARTAADAAASAATEACRAVIDRYVQAEAADALLRGDPPAGPGEMAAMRGEVAAAAAARVRDRQAGKCQR